MDRRSSRYSREDRVYVRCTLERRPCLNDNQRLGIDGGSGLPAVLGESWVDRMLI